MCGACVGLGGLGCGVCVCGLSCVWDVRVVWCSWGVGWAGDVVQVWGGGVAFVGRACCIVRVRVAVCVVCVGRAVALSVVGG